MKRSLQIGRLPVLVPFALFFGCGGAGNELSTTSDELHLTVDPIRALVKATHTPGHTDSVYSLQYQAIGFTSPPNQGFVPWDRRRSFPTTEFSLDVSADLVNQNLRFDRTGSSPRPGFPVNQVEVLQDDLGVASGFAAGLGVPLGAMPSDQVAALRRVFELMNPNVLVRKVIRDPSLIRSTRTTTRNHRRFLLLEIADPVHPITLEIKLARRPTITKLRTKENDILLRDTEVEVIFSQWGRHGPHRFPHQVRVFHEGFLYRSETRSEVAINLGFPEDTFSFPENGEPAFDSQLAHLGHRGSLNTPSVSTRHSVPVRTAKRGRRPTTRTGRLYAWRNHPQFHAG